MKPLPIQLVVLDMAGTTVRDDDAVNLCLQAALAAHHVPVTRDQVNEVMGLPKPTAIQLLLERRAGTTADPKKVRVIHDHFLARMVDHYRTAAGIEPMPFAVPALRAVRERGLAVFLNTGFSRPIVDAILQRLGWTGHDLIHGVVASDEVPRGRPHPDMIRRAMQWASVEDARAVAKVGDTPSDLQEGTAAGCGLVVGVTNGSHTREQLLPHPHTHLISSLETLPALVLATHAT
jgi:phosphonatase-like hydrolase